MSLVIVRNAKIVPERFPLASQANRIALLTGVLCGYVSKDEIKAALTQDAKPRPHRKPVVAFGKFFISVSAAARWRMNQPGGKEKTENTWVKYISRRCEQDCWEGFYWSE